MEQMPAHVQQIYTLPQEEMSDAEKINFILDRLDEFPGDREYSIAWAASLMRKSADYQRCIDFCKKMLPDLQIDDVRKNMYNQWIWSLQGMNDTMAAIELRKQLMNDGDESQARDLAKAYEAIGDIDNAIHYYEMEVDEQSDWGCEKLAELYEQKGDYKNVSKHLEKQLYFLTINDVYLWYNTGRALCLAGKEQEAMLYLQVAVRMNPAHARAHYMLGQIYQNVDDEYRALHHYHEALKADPNMAIVYNNMAALAFDNEGDVPTAISHLEHALELCDDEKLQANICLGLARLHHKILDYDKHEYYKARWAELLGFPPGFIGMGDEEEED